jgi:hypothetical protein
VSIFVLACDECDAGMGVESQEEAEEKGWTDIWPVSDDSAPWTHLGTCPEHTKLALATKATTHVRSD